MSRIREIRAHYDSDSIVVYQAYSSQIADRALQHQTFVAPFSMRRMTWIKPSFLWLMHRSRWGRKNGQQRTLAVHITRQGWEQALAEGVLTHREPSIYRKPEDWVQAFENAKVHIQWDTERSLRGAALNHSSIQVGVSRHRVSAFVNEWILKIEDLSPVVQKIRELLLRGRETQAKRLLPRERVYPVSRSVARSIHLSA